MPLDSSRLDLLMQFALLVMGEADEPFGRQLGPIHLIKYAYLGDLAFASRNEGKTYTGATWKFHNFGPWSTQVHARIEPALLGMGAERRVFQSRYEEQQDWVRWWLRDDSLLQQKESSLPASITLPLRGAIRKFGNDTPGLLDFVYRTAPMLKAAPGEELDFATTEPAPAQEPKVALRMDGVSAKRRKAFIERMNALQRVERSSRRSRLVSPVKNPRHDDVYVQGLAWLDELAGEPLVPGEHLVEFDDEVWKSAARTGKNVS